MRMRGSGLWFGALSVGAFAACTNGGGLGSVGGSGGAPSPLPASAIGVAIPTGKIGVEPDPVWGTVSGYTQRQTSQVLAFPPGAKITIENLSSTTPHTLNVIGKRSGPPPNFPKNPSFTFSPRGNGVLGPKYASGSLNPGASVTVTLSKPGIYLIGCAYHYIEFNMRDVIEVVAGATPGPTASPGPGAYARRMATLPRRAHAASQPHLIDQRRHSFTLGSLVGEPLVVTFISTHCTDACPLIDAQFADAARRIERAHLAARLLTITLDPEHDSPRTMRELAKRFEANPRYWLLAGGSVADVHTVMRAFGVVSVEGRRGYRDEHTTFVYVFNASGGLAQTMLASSALGDDIVSAVRDRRLVAER
jgi:cytochrome oxidase Cu insertion factor (SCO1/SenC/PrrC family)